MMDRIEPRSAQVIQFPKGGRNAVQRQAASGPMLHGVQGFVRPQVDCSAWYHQAAMQEQSEPRRS